MGRSSKNFKLWRPMQWRIFIRHMSWRLRGCPEKQRHWSQIWCWLQWEMAFLHTRFFLSAGGSLGLSLVWAVCKQLRKNPHDSRKWSTVCGCYHWSQCKVVPFVDDDALCSTQTLQFKLVCRPLPPNCQTILRKYWMLLKATADCEHLTNKNYKKKVF